MSQNELQRVVAEMNAELERCGIIVEIHSDDLWRWVKAIESAQAVAPGGGDMQLRARIAGELIAARDTEDGCNRIMALLAAAPASEAKGQCCEHAGTFLCACGKFTLIEKSAASSVDDVMQSFDDTWADDASSAADDAELPGMWSHSDFTGGATDAEQEQAGEDYLRKFEADNARFVEALPRKLTWQEDELPDRIWIPAAVVASYSRKPLPGDSLRVEFVRRAARVEVTGAEGKFHKAIAPHLTKRLQGIVMGAFRAALEPEK